MTGVIVSFVVLIMAIVALILTFHFRKKIESSVFLFLIAFEFIVMLAAGWAFLIYGAIIEMGNM